MLFRFSCLSFVCFILFRFSCISSLYRFSCLCLVCSMLSIFSSISMFARFSYRCLGYSMFQHTPCCLYIPAFLCCLSFVVFPLSVSCCLDFPVFPCCLDFRLFPHLIFAILVLLWFFITGATAYLSFIRTWIVTFIFEPSVLEELKEMPNILIWHCLKSSKKYWKIVFRLKTLTHNSDRKIFHKIIVIFEKIILC